MVGFYRQFLPGLATISARLHTKKHENPWTPMSEEDLTDFYNIKEKLINSEALASPDFSDLDKYPLIMGLDFSIQAMCVTISQIQKCLDGQYRRRLLFCSGRKCSQSGQNWSSHHGESATFVWGLTTYAWLLKRAPFLVETDSMSVKYINNMKSSRGVHARWAKLIGSYSFTISHARVVVEDCVSRCPSHLPEPTQEELDMEKDWEADPPPHLDLEKLAIESAQLPAHPERICQIQGDSIQMNMMFDKEKVRVLWERPDEDDRHQQDWTEQLESTITELHQKIEEEPGTWVHDWGWTQTTDQPTSHKDHEDEDESMRSKYSIRRTRGSWELQTTRMMESPSTQRKKIKPHQNPCPDTQEDHGHRHSEHSNRMVSSGISEEQATEMGLEQPDLTYRQKGSQSI